MSMLDADRLFPVDPKGKDIARGLYSNVQNLPIISPHGHTDPRWFAENKPFENPAELFVTPDPYVVRMLYSHGISLESLNIPTKESTTGLGDPREVWRTFASHYKLLRGTPSCLWIDYSLQKIFGVDRLLSAETAD